MDNCEVLSQCPEPAAQTTLVPLSVQWLLGTGSWEVGEHAKTLVSGHQRPYTERDPLGLRGWVDRGKTLRGDSPPACTQNRQCGR